VVAVPTEDLYIDVVLGSGARSMRARNTRPTSFSEIYWVFHFTDLQPLTEREERYKHKLALPLLILLHSFLLLTSSRHTICKIVADLNMVSASEAIVAMASLEKLFEQVLTLLKDAVHSARKDKQACKELIERVQSLQMELQAKALAVNQEFVESVSRTLYGIEMSASRLAVKSFVAQCTAYNHKFQNYNASIDKLMSELEAANATTSETDAPASEPAQAGHSGMLLINLIHDEILCMRQVLRCDALLSTCRLLQKTALHSNA
jgi:hypothetical protein